MSRKSELPRGLERKGEMRALQRARQVAYELAARTNTPIVLYREGKVMLVPVARGRVCGDNEP